MSDLVERLRNGCRVSSSGGEINDEAADRIEELKFTIKNLREEATMQIASSVKAFERIEKLENKIDNANMSASETHRNWKSRCYAIMSALGEDYAEDNNDD